MSKLLGIRQHVTALVRSGEKVVLFARHRELIASLHESLGKLSVCIVGGQTAKQTDAAVRAFQTDPGVMVTLCSIRAAGAGLTLTAAASLRSSDEYRRLSKASYNDPPPRLAVGCRCLVGGLVVDGLCCFDGALDGDDGSVAIDVAGLDDPEPALAPVA